MNETKKRFQVAILGDSQYGATAFHLEGNATRDAEFFPEKDGKKARLSFSIGLSENAWTLLGIAEGDSQAYASRASSEFMDCVAFGKTAENLAWIKKGARLAVTGKIVRNCYTKSDGSERESVLINVYNAVNILDPMKATNSIVAFSARGKSGEEAVMLCGVCGRVKKVSEVKYTPNENKAYLQMSIQAEGLVDRAFARGNGTYDENVEYRAHNFSATVWENRAISLSKILSEGTPVVMTGKVDTAASSNGKGVFYRMSPSAVTLYPKDANSDPSSKVKEAVEKKTEKKTSLSDEDIPEIPDDINDELPY